MVYDALGGPMHARLLHPATHQNFLASVATHQRAEFGETALKRLHELQSQACMLLLPLLSKLLLLCIGCLVCVCVCVSDMPI